MRSIKTKFHSNFKKLFTFFSQSDLQMLIGMTVDEIEYRTEYRNATKVYLMYLVSPRKKLYTPVRFINQTAVNEALGLLVSLAENKQKHLKKITELK